MPDVQSVQPFLSSAIPAARSSTWPGSEIGVFRLGDEFFAYENKCPHLEGPVCQGKILAAGDGGGQRGRHQQRPRFFARSM